MFEKYTDEELIVRLRDGETGVTDYIMNKYKKVPVCIGFLLPVFLIYTIFLFVPLVQSAYYSLTSWNGVTEKVFVGLDNFKALFSNSDYWITF